MKGSRWLALSLLVALAVSAWVAWPLPRHVRDGIPASHRPEAGGPRYLIPGDHLQFLYQLWMLADAIAGETPLFHNVYEFNQGDDAARREVGSYYFPFGLMYAAGHALGGPAVGWNLMLFLSAWLGYLMTGVLARRFCASALAAAVAALPALLLPYLWGALLGGSPTGPAMMWVPVVFLGVDLAVRDRKGWGAALAGGVLYVIPWGDLHVFFFTFMALPVWWLCCILAAREGGLPGWFRAWPRTFPPMIPLGLFMVAAYFQTALVKQSLSGTVQEGGRKASESLIYAPTWDGWFAWDPAARHNLVYVGVVAALVVLAGAVPLVLDALRRRREGAGRRVLLLAAVAAALGGIALLALGPNIPGDPHQQVLHALRKLVPPYKLIRQPAKIYCILAPFLAVGLALALDRLGGLLKPRRSAALLIVAIGVAMAWDYGRRIEPTICLLDDEQGAYRAVAEDAARGGRENRALSLPLWPGDSHWNSLTEYYATLYRTKMLNGYRPSLRRQYLADIFEPLAPMNLGHITDAHLAALLARRIGYLILQEDAFPEKVSPFPVSHTLRALLEHPRIEFLAHDREVWSFKILAPGEARRPGPWSTRPGATLFSTRRWRAADFCARTAVAPANGEGVRLAEPEDRVVLPPRFLSPFEGVRYCVLARGTGTLTAAFTTNGAPLAARAAVAPGPEWRWVELPAPAFEGARDLALELAASGGEVDVDVVTLVAGPWAPLPAAGAPVVLRADSFFRAGYSDPETGAVRLETGRTPADVVFYAPNVPLAAGSYRLAPAVSCEAPPGTELGVFRVLVERGPVLGEAPVRSGAEAAFEFRQPGNQPVRVEFRYNRRADMTLESVTLTRVTLAP
jgi:hypothetical protein